MSDYYLDEGDSEGPLSELIAPSGPLVEIEVGLEGEDAKREMTETAPSPRPDSPIEFPVFERLDFLWKTHSFIANNIRFADTKAAVTVVIATTILGALYTARLHVPLLQQAPDLWRANEWLVGTAFVLLAFAVLAGAWSVLPRLWKTDTVDHIYWLNILSYGSAEKFWQAYHRDLPETLERSLAGNIYTLASLCRWKYTLVRVSMCSAIIGGLLAALPLLLR